MMYEDEVHDLGTKMAQFSIMRIDKYGHCESHPSSIRLQEDLLSKELLSASSGRKTAYIECVTGYVARE
jgi:hypothetical protein